MSSNAVSKQGGKDGSKEKIRMQKRLMTTPVGIGESLLVTLEEQEE